ncbi:MAG: DUF2764 domain-containing protein [Rhabdochlamydiaceae bacterium]|nr:DUF2764 domain-containing protein [Rhabdochlamydiaceae bacterium]
MGNYYYLAASLPPLEFPLATEASFASLQNALELNLSKEDLEKVKKLRLFVDLTNIRLFLQEEEIDPRGNLKEKELEEALLSETMLPEYVFDFLKEHETLSEKLKNFSSLLAQFFREEIPKQTGFLREFFEFERQWRLVVLAMRAKKMRRDFAQELQFEDLHDPFVMQILAQKDTDTYEPPLEYQELSDLFQACGPDPWQQNKSLASYRFMKIQEIMSTLPFSMEWILAYLAQLMIIEQWNELNAAKGRALLDTFKNQ